MLSHTKLSVVQKNRKEGQILTVFFFPSGFSREKKNRDEKIAIFLKPVPFFALFGARAQFWFTVFFSGSESRWKKKTRKIGLWRGRKEDVSDNLEK